MFYSIYILFILIQSSLELAENSDSSLMEQSNDLKLYDMIDSRLFEAHNISAGDLEAMDPSSDLFVSCQYAKKANNSKKVY